MSFYRLPSSPPSAYWKLFDSSLEAICSLWFITQKKRFSNYSKALLFFVSFFFRDSPHVWQSKKNHSKSIVRKIFVSENPFFFPSRFAPFPPHHFSPPPPTLLLPFFLFVPPKPYPLASYHFNTSPTHFQFKKKIPSLDLYLYHPN